MSSVLERLTEIEGENAAAEVAERAIREAVENFMIRSNRGFD
jgi:hypothetical protein